MLLKYVRALVIVWSALASARPASASAVVFSDFGAPESLYQAGTGVPLTGYTTPSSLTGFEDHAFAFTPTATYTFSELDIAISHVSGANDAVVSLWTDSSGAPGVALQAWITGPVPAFGTCCVFQSFFSSGPSVSLVAGQQYWVVAASNGFGNQMEWNLNSPGLIGPGATSLNQAPFTTSTGVEGAFRVLGTTDAAVPEPSSAVLSLGGLAILGWRLRKSRASR
jgi:PEP-CTERM motif